MVIALIELLNMDCMEYMKGCEDNAFDLVVTDPPYGVNLNYKTYIDTQENWENLMSRFIPEVRRVSRMVIFPSCSIKKLPWIYKNHEPDWVISWHKGSTGHAAYIGFNSWEPLLVYGKLQPCYLHDAFTMPNTVAMGTGGHPCPKPVKWFSRFYEKLHINHDHKLYDPFMGSGSSAIAAHYFGCDFVGTEIDKDYYDAAVERFNNETKQVDMFSMQGETA